MTALPPDAPQVIGSWLSDADLSELCRRRADELSISYDEIDRIAGLAKGHTSKVLSVPPTQGFGPISRFAIPWALQMKFALVNAPEHRRQYDKRVDHAVRRGKAHHRNAKYLALVQAKGREGALIAIKNLGPEGVSRQRSNAARARWKHVRRSRAASIAAQARWARAAAGASS